MFLPAFLRMFLKFSRHLAWRLFEGAFLLLHVFAVVLPRFCTYVLEVFNALHMLAVVLPRF